MHNTETIFESRRIKEKDARLDVSNDVYEKGTDDDINECD